MSTKQAAEKITEAMSAPQTGLAPTEAKLSLQEALGRSKKTHTFVHRRGHRLTVELLQGGLYEMAEFMNLVEGERSAKDLINMTQTFEVLILERAISLDWADEHFEDEQITAEHIKKFFRTVSPEDLMQHMNILISGVVSNPKALENPPTGGEFLP